MPWIDVNDVALHYVLEGEGPPLLLLHEMGGCLHSWAHVVARLSGWRVLRPDQRGSGLSQKIVGAVTLDDLVADLAALLPALGIAEKVVVAGCAVGAGVALAFAARHPQRVAAVLAMAPATGIAEARRPATLDLAAQIERNGLRARLFERIDQTFPAQFRGADDRLAAFKGIALANDPRSYAAIQRMLVAMDLSADLPRITCPCLVLAGDSDATRPPEMVAPVAATIPGAVFRTVRSGHVMPMLTPGLVADAIGEVARRA
jgi:3-oxoadipate enol-lactonase